MNFEKIRQYLHEFLETKKEENLIPMAEFREFLRRKGIKNQIISYIILKLSSEGDLSWAGEGRKYIIRNPEAFNEGELLEKTSPLFTYLKLLIEMQKINELNPDNYVETRALMREYRKKYPKLYHSNRAIFRLIKIALCKNGFAECIGPRGNQTKIRLSEEFMDNFTPFSVKNYEKIRQILKPLLARRNEEHGWVEKVG